MTIAQRYSEIKEQLPPKATLVVISKFHSTEEIMQAYNAGARDFGENHMQELLPKVKALPKDIRWHFVGTLQRNKVKQVLPYVHLIHSVGSEKLFLEILKRSQAIGKQTDILLEVHIAQEESKHGFDQETLFSFVRNYAISESEVSKYCRIRGLMGMASFTEDQQQVEKEFANLRNFFQQVKNEIFPSFSYFDTLSMGMSGDWKIALKQGSNMLRVGSAIMGERIYS